MKTKENDNAQENFKDTSDVSERVKQFENWERKPAIPVVTTSTRIKQSLSPRKTTTSQTDIPLSREQIKANLQETVSLQPINLDEKLKRMSIKQDLVTSSLPRQANVIAPEVAETNPLPEKRTQRSGSLINKFLRVKKSISPRSVTPEPVREVTPNTDLNNRELELKDWAEKLIVWENNLREEQEKCDTKTAKALVLEKQVQDKFINTQKIAQENSAEQIKLAAERKELEKLREQINQDQFRMLTMFIDQKQIEDIKAYLKRGFDINTRDPIYGKTLLHYSVERNEEEMVSLLLNNSPKANPNVQDKLGRTPLHYATPLGNENIIQQLIWDSEKKCICNVKITDKENNTAIYYLKLLSDLNLRNILNEAAQEADRLYTVIKEKIELELLGLQNRNNNFIAQNADPISLRNLSLDTGQTMHKAINDTILLSEEKKQLIERVDAFIKELIQDKSVKQIGTTQQNGVKKEGGPKNLIPGVENSPKKPRSNTTSSPSTKPKMKFSFSSNHLPKFNKDSMESVQENLDLKK